MTLYRSVPPASTTFSMSSNTARMSFPVSALSRRNSAKVCDMIRVVSFTVVIIAVLCHARDNSVTVYEVVTGTSSFGGISSILPFTPSLYCPISKQVHSPSNR